MMKTREAAIYVCLHIMEMDRKKTLQTLMRRIFTEQQLSGYWTGSKNSKPSSIGRKAVSV